MSGSVGIVERDVGVIGLVIRLSVEVPKDEAGRPLSEPLGVRYVLLDYNGFGAFIYQTVSLHGFSSFWILQRDWNDAQHCRGSLLGVEVVNGNRQILITSGPGTPGAVE